MANRRPCESCGEVDGKVQKVVVQVDGRKVAGMRLCMSCQAFLINRIFAPKGRHR